MASGASVRRARLAGFLLLAGLLLAGCGANPPAPQPAERRAAEQAEALALDDWQHGEYARAARGFAEAARRYTAIDDPAAARRAALRQARSDLALGRAGATLTLLAALPPAADVATSVVATQAHLARGDLPAAEAALAAARAACAPPCAETASLSVLQARLALARDDATGALAAADAALATFKGAAEDAPPAAEAGNGWRLRGEALLRLGDAPAAEAAATRALDIDRRLALPEKIARDWLLIAQARAAASKVSPGGTAAGGMDEARAAYQRALEIAQAAGITDVATAAAAATAAPSLPSPAPRAAQ